MSTRARRVIPNTARAHEERVRRYYRLNTSLFRLAAGAAAEPMAVHRLPDTNERIVTAARGVGSVLDLGCGEGATLARLSRVSPAVRLAGMTLSPAQARIARRHFAVTGAPVDVIIGSYLDPGAYPSLPSPRLLVAVESMVHAADLATFLRTAAAYAAPGDTLVVVDDFIADARGGVDDPVGRRLVRAARIGWRAPSLCRGARFLRLAADAGWRVETTEDWSDEVPAGARAVRVGARLAVLLAGLPLGEVAAGLVGGSALVVGYGRGVFRYRCYRLRRPGPG